MLKYMILNQKILKYSYIVGKYLSTFLVDLRFWTFEKLSNDNYIIEAKKSLRFNIPKPINYEVIILDKNRKIINEFFPYDPQLIVNNVSYSTFKCFTRNKEKIYVSQLFIDTIFEVKYNSLTPVYFVDYGKYKLKENYLKTIE